MCVEQCFKRHTHLFLISAAIVMNACSTLVALFAEVSKKGMPISSANACTPQLAHDRLPTIESPQWSLYWHTSAQFDHCRHAVVKKVTTFLDRGTEVLYRTVRRGPKQLLASCICAHLCCLIVNDFLAGQIALVAHQQLVDILVCVPINLIQPLLHVIEALLVCHIVHHLHITSTLSNASRSIMHSSALPHNRNWRILRL